MLNNTSRNNYRFDIPDSRLTETFQWQIQNISFPSVQMETAKVIRSPKLSNTTIPATGTSFGDLQVTFLLDEEMKSYSELFSWFLTMQNPHSGTTADEANVPRTALLHILDNIKDKIVCTFRFHKIFPKQLGEIEWTYGESGDVTAMTCTVGFGIEYFEMIRKINGQDVAITPRGFTN